MNRVWHCEVCQMKTMNQSKRCNNCTERSNRMCKEIKRRKVKNDVVYFAENTLGFSLQDWQKDILRKYEQGEIIWFGSLRHGKNTIQEIIRKHQKFMSQHRRD